MLNVNISIDDEIIAQFNKLETGLVDAIDFGVLAQKESGLIIDRTHQGADVDGVQFQEYSEDYFQFKKERGGKHFTGIVDLDFDGLMLAAIDTRHFPDSSEIFFVAKDEREKARKHNEGFAPTRLPKREFFGVSDIDAEILGEMAKRDIKTFIDKL